MKGTFEGFQLYQTVAEDGVPYPEAPAAPHLVEDAPTVWHVEELTNITELAGLRGDDTGKRYNMFVLTGGPVLGSYAATYGMVRAYLPEGTYLIGWWYNGQLYGVPYTEELPEPVQLPCEYYWYRAQGNDPYITEAIEEESYNHIIENEDIAVVEVNPIGGGWGPDIMVGAGWLGIRFPKPEAETNHFIEFLKSGRSIFVPAEQLYYPRRFMRYSPPPPIEAFGQDDCDKANAFIQSIGGLASFTAADLANVPELTEETAGDPNDPNYAFLPCTPIAIAADDTHPFFVDEAGNQNVFFFQGHGSALVNPNGATPLAYLYDAETGITDTSKCIVAGNQYPAPGAGWIIIFGDANMLRGVERMFFVPPYSSFDYSNGCLDEVDMPAFISNICRLRQNLLTPTS